MQYNIGRRSNEPIAVHIIFGESRPSRLPPLFHMHWDSTADQRTVKDILAEVDRMIASLCKKYQIHREHNIVESTYNSGSSMKTSPGVRYSMLTRFAKNALIKLSNLSEHPSSNTFPS